MTNGADAAGTRMLFGPRQADVRSAFSLAEGEVVMHERLGNRTLPSMCRTWDMDEPAHDATG
jgi:hypothetical protein